jgi:hypothetical protein
MFCLFTSDILFIVFMVNFFSVIIGVNMVHDDSISTVTFLIFVSFLLFISYHLTCFLMDPAFWYGGK